MRRPIVRAALLVQLLGALSALWATGAAAQPSTGPRETVDQRFTTTRPGSPTGLGFTASYHAAGDENAPPPFMTRMVVHPPRGMRYDTGVPARCTASDAELQVLGPDACPAGSVLGEGTVEGLILMPFAHDIVFDHFQHQTYSLNGPDQQIVLIKSEGYSVVRGHFRDDGAMVWNLPACFPKLPGVDCVDDYVVQLKSDMLLPRYTTAAPGGGVRSYATTPSHCPNRGYWRTKVRYSWSDGSIDSVVTKQPCRRSR